MPEFWTFRRGFVYFASAGDGKPVKIGFSTYPRERLLTVARDRRFNPCPGAPLILLASYAGTFAHERAEHLRYRAAAMGHEWFHQTPELRRRILRLRDRASRRQSEDAIRFAKSLAA